MFSNSASKIEKDNMGQLTTNSKENSQYISYLPFHRMITGDGSPSTMWDGYDTIKELDILISEKKNGEKLKNKLLTHQIYNSLHNEMPNIYDKQKIRLKSTVQFISNNSNNPSKTEEIYFGVPDLIHSVIPMARIIAVLREPASR